MEAMARHGETILIKLTYFEEDRKMAFNSQIVRAKDPPVDTWSGTDLFDGEPVKNCCCRRVQDSISVF